MSRADGSNRGKVSGFRALLAVGLALVLCRTERFCLGDDLGPGSQATAAGQTKRPAGTGARAKNRPHVAVVESDNWTFRPTVLVRRGSSQGTGTIIASLDGETLVLTAAHVIRGRGSISVELHRYNLGIEHQPSVPGKWPRQVVAEPVASDTFADLAILRLRDMIALPFVAPWARKMRSRPRTPVSRRWESTWAPSCQAGIPSSSRSSGSSSMTAERIDRFSSPLGSLNMAGRAAGYSTPAGRWSASAWDTPSWSRESGWASSPRLRMFVNCCASMS